MSSPKDASIVEFYADNAGYRCGYCKSPNTNYSHGMWTYSLTVQDYQDLIDRGWRRSGCYCYKPTMHLTCCPMYTIRCSVLDFKLSKSQKKKLKKFHNFLSYGKKTAHTLNNDISGSPSDAESGDDMCSVLEINDVPDLMEKAERAQISIQDSIIYSTDAAFNNTLADDMCSVLEINDVPDLMEKAERAQISIQDSIIYSTDAAFNNTLADDMCSVLEINDVPDLMEKAERAQISIQDSIIYSTDAAFNNTLAVEESKKMDLDTPETSASSMSVIEPTYGDENVMGIMKSCTRKLKTVGEPKKMDLDISATTSSMTVSELIDGEERVEKIFKSPTKKLKTGDGMDPNRPLCKKAKLLRQERRENKLAQLNISLTSLENKKTVPPAKSLEDFIDEALPDSPAHRLQIKLVHVESCEMKATLNTSWKLYTKYQMAIHKEDPDECSMSSYSEFLVNSPLKPWKPKDGPPQGYGSFHQQYWLDDRLIAVGVIDILPSCVSSVYFFYDPEYQFLVLGTYGSLREIGLCRSLHHCAPSLQYYYMGFYIHSCSKMRYKGGYSPSFLLCPEVYSWHPIENCLPLLEKNKYCRFNKDSKAQDDNKVVEVGDVLVLFNNKIMNFQIYLSRKKFSSQVNFVTEYANLVGNKLSKRLLLILK